MAVSASGDAIVVWDEDTDGNGFYNVGLVRLAKANGAVTLSRRTANANGGGQQRHPAVAANFNGDFAVAWESDHTGTPGVWARSFTAAGAARHADVEVSAGSGAAAPIGRHRRPGQRGGRLDRGRRPTPTSGCAGFNPDGTHRRPA